MGIVLRSASTSATIQSVKISLERALENFPDAQHATTRPPAVWANRPCKRAGPILLFVRITSAIDLRDVSGCDQQSDLGVGGIDRSPGHKEECQGRGEIQHAVRRESARKRGGIRRQCRGEKSSRRRRSERTAPPAVVVSKNQIIVAPIADQPHVRRVSNRRHDRRPTW